MRDPKFNSAFATMMYAFWKKREQEGYNNKNQIYYLKLSEVHPFHTFRPHPFKVRDDAKMQEIVASIRVNGVMVPGLARPEKDGNGYEDARFVKVGKHLHYIDEDSSVLEKTTGEYHKEAEWLVDVLKAEN